MTDANFHDINASGHYTPERGYRDGWKDRQEGKPNQAPVNFGWSSDNSSPYWKEYRIGYDEACKQILSAARKSIQEDKQFLAE